MVRRSDDLRGMNVLKELGAHDTTFFITDDITFITNDITFHPKSTLVFNKKERDSSMRSNKK